MIAEELVDGHGDSVPPGAAGGVTRLSRAACSALRSVLRHVLRRVLRHALHRPPPGGQVCPPGPYGRIDRGSATPTLLLNNRPGSWANCSRLPLRAPGPETGCHRTYEPCAGTLGRRGTAHHGRTAARGADALLPHEALRVVVIGPGRLGPTLVASLRQAGIAVPAVVPSPPPRSTRQPSLHAFPCPTPSRWPTSSGSPRPTTRSKASPDARRRRAAAHRPRAPGRGDPLERSRLARPARAAARRRRRHPVAAPPAEVRRARRRGRAARRAAWRSPATRRPTSSSAAGWPSASAAGRSLSPTTPSPSTTWRPRRRAISSWPCRARPASCMRRRRACGPPPPPACSSRSWPRRPPTSPPTGRPKP